MNDTSRVEAMRATTEARDRVGSSRRSSKADAMEAALKRYLSAEQYHQLAEEKPDGEQGTDEKDHG